MRVAIFLLFLSTSLFSTTIINNNIYKQDDSVDLMLTFDEPYLGKISQKRDNNSTILLLDGVKIEKSITREINSKILQKIHIFPFKSEIVVKVDSKRPFTIKASKTVDNYGLRIRIKSEKVKRVEPIKERVLETKKESEVSGSLFKVILVLVFLFALLFFLKRWMQGGSLKESWLFSKNIEKRDGIRVLKQKMLDHKNRVVLLEFGGKNYLVVLGESSILLDKFDSDSPLKGDSFDTLLKENSTKLDEILESNRDLS